MRNWSPSAAIRRAAARACICWRLPASCRATIRGSARCWNRPATPSCALSASAAMPIRWFSPRRPDHEPHPQARHSRHHALCRRPRPRRRRRARSFKLSSNESRARPEPAGRRGLSTSPRAVSTSIPRAARRSCARRSPKPSASTRRASSAATARTNFSPCWPAAYLRPGDEVLFSEHAFLVYKIAALANSAMPVAVPEKNLRTDVDAMLAAVTTKTRLVYLANPNNPTGSYLPHDEVRRLHAGLAAHTLLVIDAAYAEYVRRNDYETRHRDGVELSQRRDDAHLFQDLRPRGPARRLGLLSGRRRRRAQSHSRTVQRLGAGAARGSRGARGSRACRCRNSRTTRNGATG